MLKSLYSKMLAWLLLNLLRIALDMQRSHPELQIVGPGPEKFFRRGDYGVGKFFDATISNANQE